MAGDPRRIDHDRLFKELIQTFLAEFLDLFFPEASGVLDLTHCRFLTQEVFSDLTAGERHIVDVVAEATLRAEPGVILIHVEHQGYAQEGFNERMFRYFSRLYEKHRKRILPIAVFAYDQVREEPDHFRMGFNFLEVLRFQFHKVELRRLPWREYIRKDNPVAAALLSKMGFRPEERVQVKLEFLRMLTRLQLDPARLALLGGFFETYLRLDPQEEEDLSRELKGLEREEEQKMLEITTSWHEKGEMKAKREDILQFLVTRFGFESRKVEEQIGGLQDLEALNRLLTRLYAAQSSEEAQGLLREATNQPS